MNSAFRSILSKRGYSTFRGIIPPNIAATAKQTSSVSSAEAATEGQDFGKLVSFYRRIPKGPAPAGGSAGGLLARYQNKYFTGEKPSPKPVLHAIFFLLVGGYSIHYAMHISSSKSTAKDSDPFGSLVSFERNTEEKLSKLSLNERQRLQNTHTPHGLYPAGGSDNSSGNGSNSNSLWDFDLLDKSSAKQPVASKAKSVVSSRSAVEDFDPLGPSLTFSPPPPQGQRPPSSLRVETSLTKDATPVMVPAELSPIPMDSDSDSAETSPRHDSAGRPPDTVFDAKIAQIMQQGFDLDQAKAALTICHDDAASAIELLIQQNAGHRRAAARPQQRQGPGPMGQARDGRAPLQRDQPTAPRRTMRDRDRTPITPGTGERQFAIQGDRRDIRSHPSSGSGGDGGLGQQSFSEAADKFMNAANDIGNTVWSQASLWLKKGKEKFQDYQKALTEQPSPGTQIGGLGQSKSQYKPYRDYSSSDEDKPYVSSRRRGGGGPNRASGQDPKSAAQQDQRFNAVSLSTYRDYSSSEDEQDVPSFRERFGKGLGGRTAGQPADTADFIDFARVPIPEVTQASLQGAVRAKQQANEKFKLGQFDEAIRGYAQATSWVGEASVHPYLIVLFNNLALCNAKNGDTRAAIEYSTRSIQLCEKYGANGTDNLAPVVDEVISYAALHAKALQRRANAYEVCERYQEALDDWGRLLGMSGVDATMASQAKAAVVRCQRAIDPPKGKAKLNSPASSTRSVPPKPSRPSAFDDSLLSVRTEVQHSEGVAKMREKEREREAEEAEQFAQAGAVETEINAWKAGKAQNLRALLSSLHMVIPDWKSAGMHELVEPQKVKRAYMRAIARTHPDKLPQGVDVRTKMVAGAIFGTLNEAWDAFKSQNNL
ncbi:auxilin-like clathrin-binding protein required for normal clathrin function [Spiromyces aspiralis]|uniref:Auxilin-like clathrin-binding protein required for normal clathrin function n=1 Tax=Spiromyces aspiralis TaxID=68401 RepID=A0ACC1HTM5_9FUNG|nr:auxilin-like clathrin-binding protein required for normal clathrin function [Spiromyces aspiralis]